MGISAGLEPELLTCNPPEDAKLFSIKFFDKALHDQVYFKIIENTTLVMKLQCN